MITISNLEKQYADKQLFKDLDLMIYDGERVGIVGANGTGKSTLLKIIAGEVGADYGYAKVDGEIGFLKQITEYTQEDFFTMVDSPDVLRKFLEIKSRLKINTAIEFSHDRLKTLSGGEKTKLMLAGILAKQPEVLLLDEPTNHLDIAGADWLIEALNSYEGTVIVVSHDRYFLNKTINKIIELENGAVREFYGDYDAYEAQKQMEYNTLMSKYESQRSMERKINGQIKALNAWSVKGEKNARRQGGMMSDSRIKGAETNAQVSASKLASMAKGKIARLEQMRADFVERPYKEGDVHYKLNASPFRSQVLVRAENLGKKFGNNVLFSDSNFTIEAGEKISLAGGNGTGKTTLIKIILGEESYEGNLFISPAVKIAYLSQDVFDLDEDLSVKQKACQFSGENRTLFLSNLINMNMSRQVFDRKISTLSLGERMRIKMSEIVLSDYNFLIMDEPTNHLDLNNKIFLERILKEYKGCLLLVSHDRTLTGNVCNASLEISDKVIKKKEATNTNEYGVERT